jgi:hypothetical protein
MKIADLEKRLVTLEKQVELLKNKLANGSHVSGPWWITEAGRFSNDPIFDEIVKLGREYRESLHPDYRKKKTSRKKKVKDARP